jgi:hypothetical protein
MEYILFIIILYILYVNYIFFRIINILNNRLLKYDKLLIESDMKIKRITTLLYKIHKKTIEVTDIKLEVFEENIINKLNFKN